MQTRIKAKLTHKDAKTPKRATDGSAGYDLYAVESCVVQPNARVLIPTGISLEFSENMAAIIKSRSSLAVQYGFDILAGLIDSDYRGEIKVAGINHGNEPIEFKKGDRIAQIVFTNIYTSEISLVDDMSETERGKGGFGHTGR